MKKQGCLSRLGEFDIAVLKNGFVRDHDLLCCIFCGFETEKGVVYRDSETLFEAEKFMQIHIERAHGSVFEGLVNLDRKTTGLSDHQCALLKMFYRQVPDEQIQKELEIGSISTIRNHRFVLKEKERQARIFMTIMELIKENENAKPVYIRPHRTATMVDDRYKVTSDENEKLLRKYFPDGLDGQLKVFTMKEKGKLVVLRHIAKRFDPDASYTEKQVDKILKTVFSDHVTLRRYLIEYGFMDRTTDCSRYWMKK